MEDYAIIVDLEVDLGGDRKDPSPYNKENTLAAIGYTTRRLDGSLMYEDDEETVYIVRTVDASSTDWATFKDVLKDATYVVAHNAKFDVAWLREVGIDCRSKIIDTMINEYILNKGIRDKLSLKALAEKYDVTRKDDSLADAFKQGLNYSDMSKEDQTTYLYYDIVATAEVFERQEALFKKNSNMSLIPIRDLMCEFCDVLTDIERSGMAIDTNVMHKVDHDYQIEQAELTEYLNNTVKKLVGDTPINLSSPEQLSQVIYSYKLTNKKTWREVMNIGVDARGKPKRRPKMMESGFVKCIDECFTPTLKTQAKRCLFCRGTGGTQKYKKDGTPYKNITKCVECNATGFVYKDLSEIAGLKINPVIALSASGGFKTDKHTLVELERGQSNPEVKKFLNSLIRLSAIDTYRSSFIEGIFKNMVNSTDNILHANFNQCTTATGRLSSSNPNLQNMPKGKLFPVRKAFVSRFKDGQLLEVDYSQLEFRVAGILARDEKIKKEVEEGFDVHSYTAKVLTENGEPTDRGSAKASTFRPLYGGTQGTFAQRVYFQEFFGKYSGVFDWHERLQDEAIQNETITTATGRQFKFPNVYRTKQGKASVKTQIVNYPVQSVATADIVPLGVIMLHKQLRERNLKSLVINTVHDSVVVDCHPDEIEEVKQVASVCLVKAQDEAEKRFGLDKFIPLEVEMSIGKNWMEQESLNV
jgi:DNA polymerase I-like protein with 3'-5' exonuclease and polymerase domains